MGLCLGKNKDCISLYSTKKEQIRNRVQFSKLVILVTTTDHYAHFINEVYILFEPKEGYPLG